MACLSPSRVCAAICLLAALLRATCLRTAAGVLRPAAVAGYQLVLVAQYSPLGKTSVSPAWGSILRALAAEKFPRRPGRYIRRWLYKQISPIVENQFSRQP